MAAEEQQDGSKTLVSFVVGLLIGGMLVWAFSGPTEQQDRHDEINEETAELATDTNTKGGDDVTTTEARDVAPAIPTLPVGDGSVVANDQAAGMSVQLEKATYPFEEGWIGVRDYNNGQLSFIKGVVRFSAAGGLVPQSIVLQYPTQAGREYAIVMFSENGDNVFNPAGDVQVDQIFSTFTAK